MGVALFLIIIIVSEFVFILIYCYTLAMYTSEICIDLVMIYTLNITVDNELTITFPDVDFP